MCIRDSCTCPYILFYSSTEIKSQVIKLETFIRLRKRMCGSRVKKGKSTDEPVTVVFISSLINPRFLTI